MTQPVLGKFFTVRSKLDPRMVLGIQDGADQPGARLVTSPEYTFGGRTAAYQLWYFDVLSTVRSKLNGFCIAIDGESTSWPTLGQTGTSPVGIK